MTTEVNENINKSTKWLTFTVREEGNILSHRRIVILYGELPLKWVHLKTKSDLGIGFSHEDQTKLLRNNLMGDKPDSSKEDKGENHHKWIFTVLSVPQIGGLLTTIVALGPAAIFSLIFILITSPEEIAVPGGPVIFVTAVLLITMLLVTWWWLNYLEGKLDLVILLPIPFINIPLRWILYPFMLPFFGIRRLYRYLTQVVQ